VDFFCAMVNEQTRTHIQSAAALLNVLRRNLASAAQEPVAGSSNLMRQESGKECLPDFRLQAGSK